jgi:hypothetical protein
VIFCDLAHQNNKKKKKKRFSEAANNALKGLYDPKRF